MLSGSLIIGIQKCAQKALDLGFCSKSRAILREATGKRSFLRLRCAYAEWRFRDVIANYLICLVVREGLEPSTSAL
jgi:hypothetical protein